MTFSEQVIAEISAARKDAPLFDPSNLTAVLSNLIFMQQVISASERLLKEAAYESDRKLRGYFERHLDEELNHAEWLHEDLKTAGIDTRKLPLVRAAVEMAGSQYYLIKHVDPVCLLGYMAVLEGFPADMRAVETLEQLHGKALFRTLRHHAQADLEHRKELFSMIDRVGAPCILDTAKQTAVYMNELSRALACGADFTKEQ